MSLRRITLAVALVFPFFAGCSDLGELMAEVESSRSSTSAPSATASAERTEQRSEEEKGGARYFHINWGMYTSNPPHGIPKEIALDAMVNELSVQGIEISALVAVEHADRICDYVHTGGDYYDLVNEIEAEDAAGRQAMDGISNSDLVAYLPLAIGAYCPAAGLKIFGSGAPIR